MTQTLQIQRLATQDYAETLNKMRSFTHSRNAHTLDQIWTLQHFPVFTQGQAGKAEHVLRPGNIPIINSDRGGQVTYHGPGQLIVYFLLDVNRKKIGIRDLISRIEQSVIDLLDKYHISSNADPKAPGIYIQGKKICSIGLRVRKGCTYHGISLNVDMDLEPFSRINPCGYPNMQMTQMCEYMQSASLNATIDELLPILLQNIEYTEFEYAKN